MMRLVKLALVLGLAVLLTSAAVAQRPVVVGPGGFGRPIGAGLLQNKGVQEELKMDAEQIEKLREATKKFYQDQKETFDKMRDPSLSREDRAALMKKMAEAGMKASTDILKPEQKKRLEQIQNQAAGIALFDNEETQKALNLTDEQKDKIKTIREDLGKDMRELYKDGGGRGPEIMKKMQGLRKEAMANATKALNSSQQATLKDMLGAPYEIKFEGFRPVKPRERPVKPEKP